MVTTGSSMALQIMVLSFSIVALKAHDTTDTVSPPKLGYDMFDNGSFTASHLSKLFCFRPCGQFMHECPRLL
jgi:hypothetical protein